MSGHQITTGPGPMDSGAAVTGMSYRKLRSMRRRSLIPAATGPCEIPGCRPSSAVPFVYDHCHAHDYVRGVLCNLHNGAMALIDACIILAGSRHQAEGDQPALLDYWHRCANCAAGGGWRPRYRLTGNYTARIAADRAAELLLRSDPGASPDAIERAYRQGGAAADPGAVYVAGAWCYSMLDRSPPGAAAAGDNGPAIT